MNSSEQDGPKITLDDLIKANMIQKSIAEETIKLLTELKTLQLENANNRIELEAAYRQQVDREIDQLQKELNK